MLDQFAQPGKASFIVGGQWGSEAKGAAAAYLAKWHNDNNWNVPNLRTFDIATTNAGAQAGHTSTHDGRTKVVFHLPTYSLYRPCFTYLNAGSVIDPDILLRELDENPEVLRNGFAIHPNAAVITPECREAEGRDDSAQTKIASTRKGVGEALARKVLRSGQIARQHPALSSLVKAHDLNGALWSGASVLVEVPQGIHLSVDSPFWPHTTSRNCTVMQAMSDAGIHPSYYGKSMLVLRTFPIRVGNILRPDFDDKTRTGSLGFSGGCFPDQQEISWEQLGVKPEITTVTKRVRRVFTFSREQAMQSIALTRPDLIFLSFCDYCGGGNPVEKYIDWLRRQVPQAEILTGWGPATSDVRRG